MRRIERSDSVPERLMMDHLLEVKRTGTPDQVLFATYLLTIPEEYRKGAEEFWTQQEGTEIVKYTEVILQLHSQGVRCIPMSIVKRY